jgi:hypothetical protein
MDVEGAEWESLLATPGALLAEPDYPEQPACLQPIGAR